MATLKDYTENVIVFDPEKHVPGLLETPRLNPDLEEYALTHNMEKELETLWFQTPHCELKDTECREPMSRHGVLPYVNVFGTNLQKAGKRRGIVCPGDRVYLSPDGVPWAAETQNGERFTIL